MKRNGKFLFDISLQVVHCQFIFVAVGKVIQDSLGFWIPLFGLLRLFVSGTWILVSILKRDFGFLGLNSGALCIQPKIPEISVGTSKGTDHFGLVRPEYSRLALKEIHFDRSGHFGRSDWNVPFHLTKLLSPVPPCCILLTRTITKRAVACVRSVQPECTVPLGK